jgi:hypothetical protein
MIRFATALIVAACLFPAPAAGQFVWTSSRPDGHAPLGVMGEHTHEAGEWMLSYRFMYMRMDGNRVDTDGVEPGDVLDDFMVTPLTMPMTMHMPGVMFAPHDRVTLMAMVPILDISMDHQTRSGGEFTTEASGLGDIKVGGMVSIYDEGPMRVHLNGTASFPTGSIEREDQTPMSGGNDVQLPYPMQLGSGTFDVIPGITVLAMAERLSWGAQGLATIRLGENDREYTLGNRFQATTWGAYRLGTNVSASVRALLETWGNIAGGDPANSVNPAVVPTARTDLRGGTRFDIPVGLNFWVSGGALAGHRLAVELNIPVYQSLDGPQLETDWILTAGWQWSIN